MENLSKIQMEDGRYRVMAEKLASMRAQVQEDSSVLATLAKRLESYRNSGLSREYDETVEVYNQRVPSARAHVEEYNDYVTKYNEFIKTLKDQDLASALNGCLDNRVFFP